MPDRVKQAPTTKSKSFERWLDRYWSHYEIVYDFEACLDFEKQRLNPNFGGSEKRNIMLNREVDQELQVL